MSKILMPSLAGYKKKYLKSDVGAALVVTAIAIPESLGFAAIAGLPPVTGLYTALLAPLVFALFAHSKRLVVGADSATAILVASGATLVAQVGTAMYANTVVILGILTALMLIVMSLLRFGFIADLISRPVLIGFLAGVGVQLMVRQIPELLGTSASGSLPQYIEALIKNAHAWNGMAITVAVLVIGTMVIARKTRVPGALIGLVLASLFAALFHLGSYGVKFIGALPQGLPELAALPDASGLLGICLTLAPVAFSIALVIIAQSSATIRSAAAEHDESVRLNRDILALGIANAVSALTRGFAVNGSPPRTFAADQAGGRSQLVNVFMALLIGVLLVWGGWLFAYIPVPALAAVVFMIGLHLVRVKELRAIYATHKTEFVIAIVTLVAVALFGVRQGLFIAIIIGLMERLLRQYHPHDQVLLRDGELSAWAKERIDPHHRHSSHPEGLLVYRFDGSLFFENVEYFEARVKAAIKRATAPVKYLLVDAGAMDTIDYTAVQKLQNLYRHLANDGIKMGFSHVSPNLRRQFDTYGITDLVEEGNIFPTLSEAIKRQADNTRSATAMAKHLAIDPEEYVMIGGGVLEARKLRRTHDVDLVVSEAVYKTYRDDKAWKEYVQDNGKRILSRHGYNLMRSWMGYTLVKLRDKADMIDGVPCMSVEQLISAKLRLGRSKDIDDVALLRGSKKHRS